MTAVQGLQSAGKCDPFSLATPSSRSSHSAPHVIHLCLIVRPALGCSQLRSPALESKWSSSPSVHVGSLFVMFQISMIFVSSRHALPRSGLLRIALIE